MVAGYDPEKEVVFCFVRAGFDCYKIITNPALPEAAEKE